MINGVIVRCNANEINVLQDLLSNKLYRIASRTKVTTFDAIEYWEAYAGYLRAHRATMTKDEVINRCDSTIDIICTRIEGLRAGSNERLHKSV
ncbi:MAG: hypothetical protein BMS9Abin11_1580 [Gammaproteobacteria bacterium]|nr:MAG: hypothetical protein BMS9Abin11_1580 [Gammaproteobacteria bacterium]